ncbi:unannotated protein [freshwater metagenome]|uniref:Unannotated protein n=1 Tax=freshwater metagenome TaxID=449393 RepID=A0A6J7Q0E1_9ZZZZ
MEYPDICAPNAGPDVMGSVAQRILRSVIRAGTSRRFRSFGYVVPRVPVMSPGPHSALLVPGLSTGIGSLPHLDPEAAVSVSLAETPRLPFAPQLPNRSPREGMIAEWVVALPEVEVADDGSLSIDSSRIGEAPTPSLNPDSHSGLLAFLEALRVAPENPKRIKLQVTGPLTLGIALEAAGLPSDVAFRRAGEVSRAWVQHLEALVTARFPATGLLLFIDEPALVRWRHGDEPIGRDEAIDLLSGTLAVANCITGVHVCGDGDARLAHAAGPDVLGITASDSALEDADVLMRHLEADGWIAWGAVPTDRPVGDSTEGPWRRLVGLWCELTRRGCDPVRVRTHGLVTPACGLAGHGEAQAAHALHIASEMADRIGDQAVAARLTVGA